MNKKRRKQIEKIISALEKLLDEETAVQDNMPENLMGSQIYEDSELATEQLEAAIDALQEI